MKIVLSRKTQYILALAVIVVVIGILLVVRAGNGEYETMTVERRDLTEEVMLSGTVEARIVANLGFEVSGTVQNIFVTENDETQRGARLITLSLGTLPAELQSARADVAIRKAEAANTGIDVENAWSELLSDDLIAEPQGSTYTQTAPIITGRYSGSEGTYKFRIREQTQPTKYDLYVFDLETVGPVEIKKTGPTALGTRGLFVSFPDGVAAYEDTTWYVTLPNTKGASYATNYSTYQQAEANLRAQQNGATVIDAQLQKAEAEVARIEAQIAQRTLTAPFDGVVAVVHVNPGEAVSTNEPVISLISDDGFGVEVDLPEIDSVKVTVGNPVSIRLDAFGDTDIFSGTVVAVNRAETFVDNVSVYEARIAFDADDSRIASGMTAEVAITTNRADDVLAVPMRAVKYREDGTPYVLVENLQSGNAREVDITTGLRSSESFFEVRAGLSDGDVVRLSS